MHAVDCASIEKWVLDNIYEKIMTPESLDALAQKMAAIYEKDFNEKIKSLGRMIAERNRMNAKIEKLMDIVDQIADNDIIINKINTYSDTIKKIK